MAKPKHKSMRDQPEMYDELKKAHSFSVTPTAIKKLDSHAKKSGISRSELVEQFARALDQLQEQPPTQTNPWSETKTFLQPRHFLGSVIAP